VVFPNPYHSLAALVTFNISGRRTDKGLVDYQSILFQGSSPSPIVAADHFVLFVLSPSLVAQLSSSSSGSSSGPERGEKVRTKNRKRRKKFCENEVFMIFNPEEREDESARRHE
jgi:hypothetical protein